MRSGRPCRLSAIATVLLIILVQIAIVVFPQFVQSADSPGNKVELKVIMLDPACPGVADFISAEDEYRNKKIKEAKGFFLKAIAEAEANPGKMPPLVLGHANHSLGHCLDYFWEGDHGEKNFENATKIYEKNKLAAHTNSRNGCRSWKSAG